MSSINGQPTFTTKDNLTHLGLFIVALLFIRFYAHCLEGFYQRLSTGPGHWPDADMLPLGHIAIRSCEHGIGDRWTRFSKDEQITMMTLWCIFRSPLMVGCELRDNDEWTLSILTNPEVLRILNHSHSARQLYHCGHFNSDIAWTAADEDGSIYLAMFNTGNIESTMETCFAQMGIEGSFMVRDLWARENLGILARCVSSRVPPHGARLIKLVQV